MVLPRVGCLYRLAIECIVITIAATAIVLWRDQYGKQECATVPVDHTSSVLERVHLMGDLVTGLAVVQTIIRNGEAREWLSVKVGTTEILFVAVGEVRAGIDLNQLDETALVVDGDKITVKLPPCKVLDLKLDVQKSYVYDFRRSLALSPPSIHLQSSAERQALEEIKDTAITAGLLAQSEKQAKILLRYWFGAVGFRTVEFAKEGAAEVVAPAFSVDK